MCSISLILTSLFLFLFYFMFSSKHRHIQLSLSLSICSFYFREFICKPIPYAIFSFFFFGINQICIQWKQFTNCINWIHVFRFTICVREEVKNMLVFVSQIFSIFIFEKKNNEKQTVYVVRIQIYCRWELIIYYGGRFNFDYSGMFKKKVDINFCST